MKTDGAMTIQQFCGLYKIGRTTAYDEINTGRLRAVKAKRRTLISQDAAREWFDSLPEIKPQKSR
jgi:hypothetical protein